MSLSANKGWHFSDLGTCYASLSHTFSWKISPTEVSYLFTKFAATSYLKGHSIDSRHLESKLKYFQLLHWRLVKAGCEPSSCTVIVSVDSNINCRKKDVPVFQMRVWMRNNSFFSIFNAHREQIGMAGTLSGPLAKVVNHSDWQNDHCWTTI